MTSVGDSPRHKVVTPSLREIFLNASKVELNVRLCVSSTAQSSAAAEFAFLIVPISGPATQYSMLLPIKKTSRQHAVTPRFGGGDANAPGGDNFARFAMAEGMKGLG